MKLRSIRIAASAALASFTLFAGPTVLETGEVRLSGPIGERYDRMVRNHVFATDPLDLTQPFHARTETHWWQTEFWGKYMHSACPVARSTGCELLRGRIAASVKDILSTQTADGYIGNYKPGAEYAEHWDVWGQKYTIMGLLHWYDLAGDKTALAAARRLCDLMITRVGPEGRPLHTVGNYAGLAACSVLEPIMGLYRRTRERRYLDFAAYIVREMDHPDGPRLIRDALDGVPVGDRGLFAAVNGEKTNRTKAYEMMSCYQGLLEYYEVTGERQILEAAVKSAESIARDEINLVGGAATSEHWYHGARRQHLPYARTQETCVTITWMRLCGKLLELTGETRWADELEKTFYNAYLAALKSDGSAFAGYTPLNGSRWYGQDHCNFHTDCCNANGPRGFLAFLREFVLSADDRVAFNFYASSFVRVPVPALAREACFRLYTRYPVDGDVDLEFQSPEPMTFALALRIPVWSEGTRVQVNGERVDGVRAGGYFEIRRAWQPGDRVRIDFDLKVRAFTCGGFRAYARGPVALARDSRLAANRPLDEAMQDLPGANEPFPPNFTVVRPPSDDFLLVATTTLPFIPHMANPDGRRWSTVSFCDYASAANLWRAENSMRLWLPLIIEPAGTCELNVGRGKVEILTRDGRRDPGEETEFIVEATDSFGARLTNGVVTVVLDDLGSQVLASNRVDLAKGNPFAVRGRLAEPGTLCLQVDLPGGSGGSRSVVYDRIAP